MVVGLPWSFSPFWGCLPVPVLTAGGGRVLSEASGSLNSWSLQRDGGNRGAQSRFVE